MLWWSCLLFHLMDFILSYDISMLDFIFQKCFLQVFYFFYRILIGIVVIILETYLNFKYIFQIFPLSF